MTEKRISPRNSARNTAKNAPMLGRVANGIFWMYRYLERAENTARLLAAGHRMTLTRGEDDASEEWRSVLTTLGLMDAYKEHYDDFLTVHVCDFVLRSKHNRESVLSMFDRARNNARTCRSAITSEVWEAVNEGWMTMHDLLKRQVRDSGLNKVIGAIRRESTLVRGATHGSMLRNEAYSFGRAGTFLERADNTARILDVKYYLLLPSVAHVGKTLDTSQWDNVLRSLSGDRAYRWLNSGRMDSRSIADFLILDNRFPRSLAYCYDALAEDLRALARLHGTEMNCHEEMRKAATNLSGKVIGDVLEQGLHEFLLDFIADNRLIAGAISRDYRFFA